MNTNIEQQQNCICLWSNGEVTRHSSRRPATLICLLIYLFVALLQSRLFDLVGSQSLVPPLSNY